MKKYLSLAILAIMATSITSCLKDGKENLPPGGSPAVIEFSTNTFTAPASDLSAPVSLYVQSFDLGPSGSFTLNVGYTGGSPAPQDITVNLDNDPAKIEAYNEYAEEEFLPLPAAQFSMPTSVVIKKGENLAKVTVTVKPNTFDLAHSYVIPLHISSVSTGTVSGNYGTILVNVGAKNMYDGIYSDKGFVVRDADMTLGGPFKGQSIELITAGANSVTFVPLWADGSAVGGIGGTTATVNPTTNKVTMSATSNPALVNNPAYDNRYDPATKTFYLSYYWGTGPANRAHVDTLTYKGPR